MRAREPVRLRSQAPRSQLTRNRCSRALSHEGSATWAPRFLRRAVPHRRLERQPGVPRKENPGVLRHFGDEGVDQRLAHRLGVDRGEMRVAATDRAPCARSCRYRPGRRRSAAPSPCRRRAASSRRTTPSAAAARPALMVVARRRRPFDHAHAEFARDDRRRHQAAAGHATTPANGPARSAATPARGSRDETGPRKPERACRAVASSGSCHARRACRSRHINLTLQYWSRFAGTTIVARSSTTRHFAASPAPRPWPRAACRRRARARRYWCSASRPRR